MSRICEAENATVAPVSAGWAGGGAGGAAGGGVGRGAGSGVAALGGAGGGAAGDGAAGIGADGAVIAGNAAVAAVEALAPSFRLGDGIFLRMARVSISRPVAKTRISMEDESSFDMSSPTAST